MHLRSGDILLERVGRPELGLPTAVATRIVVYNDPENSQVFVFPYEECGNGYFQDLMGNMIHTLSYPAVPVAYHNIVNVYRQVWP